jgi:hypothetical protein
MKYQVTGFVVWHGARLYLKRRFGSAPKKVGAALGVAGGIGLALGAQRRRSGD